MHDLKRMQSIVGRAGSLTPSSKSPESPKEKMRCLDFSVSARAKCED